MTIELPKTARNKFTLKWYSGVDHEGNNIGYQCKSLSVNIKDELYSALIDIGAGFDDRLPQGIDNDTVKNFDDIYVTHNHYDHIGGLPLIIRRFLEEAGNDKHIYMSNLTAQTLPSILMDMQKHMERKITKQNNKIKSEGGREFLTNPYKKEDIYDLFTHKRLIDPRGYSSDVHRILNGNMSVKALYGGHIFGANQYMFKIVGNGKNKNTNILFSGDLGRINQPIHFDVPDIVTTEKVDHLIIEGTYANKNHSSWEVEKQSLIDEIKNRKGKILIPTFSNTRLVQIILLLRDHRNMYHKNTSDDKYNLRWGSKVFIDSKLGMKLYQDICNYNGEIPGISTEQQEKLRMILESIYSGVLSPFAIADKKTILDRSQKDIIIAGGGMGSVGPSQGYIPYFLESSEKNKIIFTGYQAENTNGRIIQEKGILHIGGKYYDLSSDRYIDKKISTNISMSAHADQGDLLTYIDKTSKRENCKIFIDHTGIQGYVLKDKIIEELSIKRENIIIPEIGKDYIFDI